MTRILVIHASDYGHTKQAAEAIAAGAAQIDGTDVTCVATTEVREADLLTADAIVLGSPVHMGSVHWRMKRFIDETLGRLWGRNSVVGRVGAVFATGGGHGGAGGGCEFAMLSMLAVLAELGLILVPLPKHAAAFHAGGLHWGPYARCATDDLQQTDVPDGSIDLLREHGANVARVATLTFEQPGRSIFDPALQ